MTAQEITDQIEVRVRDLRNARYEDWTIGVTDDPSRRRAEHGHPWFWRQWEADTETVARAIERLFLGRGMREAAGRSGGAGFVYIF